MTKAHRLSLWFCDSASQSHLRTPHTIDDSNFSLLINCDRGQHLQFVWLFFIPLVFFICFCGWLSILLYQPYWPMLFRTQTHMLWQQTNALWTAQVLSKTIWWSKVIIKNFSSTLILWKGPQDTGLALTCLNGGCSMKKFEYVETTIVQRGCAEKSDQKQIRQKYWGKFFLESTKRSCF